MDELIRKVKATVEQGISLDLEILLDDLIVATKQKDNQHKEDLHAQGRGFQQFYDSIINQLKEIVASEINYIKSEPSSVQAQHFYKTLKAILNMLNDIPTVF